MFLKIQISVSSVVIVKTSVIPFNDVYVMSFRITSSAQHVAENTPSSLPKAGGDVKHSCDSRRSDTVTKFFNSFNYFVNNSWF